MFSTQCNTRRETVRTHRCPVGLVLKQLKEEEKNRRKQDERPTAECCCFEKKSPPSFDGVLKKKVMQSMQTVVVFAVVSTKTVKNYGCYYENMSHF